MLARRAPALAVLAVAGLAVLWRLPFWNAPLTADEGGYSVVARLWAQGRTLYDGAWVDRPQGLILVFRTLHFLGVDSVEAIRATAAGVAVLVVLTTMLVTLRLARETITALAAGLLAATVGASPFIEGFTLSSELLASLPAALSLLAFVLYLERRRPGWLVLAGLLTGCAVLVRQSAFDAGLAALAYLLWRERRRGLLPAAALVTSAFVPVAAAAASASSFHRWWFAVVGYRGTGDSLLTGSPLHRLSQFWDSAPLFAAGLGLLLLLAGLGWRRSPLLARLWLGAAVLGVLGGGNFHPHYYLQLVPPLSLLGALGLVRLLSEPRPAVRAVTVAAAVATLAWTVPLWLASPSAQAKRIWPHDPHLRTDGAVARYVRAHTRPGDRILALWAAADLYDLSGREPAVRYLWWRNIQTIDGALGEVRTAIAQRRAALVVAVQRPDSLDPSGTTQRLLLAGYRRVALVEGVPVYGAKSR
ncbi:MAG: glycosyltransferase family 39 protein [Gaiellaceae bacterium]